MKTTGDFYELGNWNSGNPSATLDGAIDNGGTALITNSGHDSIPYLFLGSQQNSSGTLEISGSGVASFTTLVVGALNATGTLKVTTGGKLTTFGGPIGSDYLGVGRATVSGTGSNWKVTGSEMVVGGNGIGNLILENSGSFTVGGGTGRIQLANHPVSEGNLVFGSGGAAGSIAASEIYNGEGRGTVIFNHSESGLVFAPKLTGIKTLNGYLNVLQQGTGTTILTGNSNLAGSTKTEGQTTVIVPAVTVAAGTLLVSGSILGSLADIIVDDQIVGQEKSTGEIAVLAGGTLGGNGFIEGKTNVLGTLAPGIGVGLLKFGGDIRLDSASSVSIELGGKVRGTGFDAIDLAGSLTYGGTLKLTLRNGFTPSIGDKFDLFDGFTAYAGTFANVTFSSGAYATLFDPATGILTVAAIPEPRACGMVSLGVISLGLARWRRNAAQRA